MFLYPSTFLFFDRKKKIRKNKTLLKLSSKRQKLFSKFSLNLNIWKRLIKDQHALTEKKFRREV